MKKVLLFSFLVIAVSLVSAFAQDNVKTHKVMVSDAKGWHKIGETTVQFVKEREEVIIEGADRFAAVKFKVIDAPIYLKKLEVYFESGDKQDIDINKAVKVANESEIIKINGGERNLKKIVFVYKTLPNQKDEKAHVEIWGLKTNTDKK